MLALIGGTGLYELPGMVVDERIDAPTPFGTASGAVVRGRVGARPLLFLARHGAGHRLLPHEVNYRANVFALKRAGATALLTVSAVGSLVEAIAPGELALPGQYFDWTRGARRASFFGDGVAAHVSTARPVSARLAEWVMRGAASEQIRIHCDLTYACVEGPRLGTRAESFFLQRAGCHVVGMTNVPEVFLAREAQLGYASIGIVTDYDCWRDEPGHDVSVAVILERYAASLASVRRLLDALLATGAPEPEPEIRCALRDAMLTPDAALAPAQREWLDVLRR